MKMAALSGASAAVRLQLARGAAVNATDEQGRSALMLAAMRGHAGTCRLLLEAGADPDILDVEGLDAVGLAAPRNHADVVLAILEYRARAAPPPVRNPPKLPAPQPASVEPSRRDTGRDEEERRTRPASQSVMVEPSGTADDFDLSAWEAEDAPQEPKPDVVALRQSVAIQAAIAEHLPIDEDPDWLDVEVRLPEPRRRRRHQEDVDDETLYAWRHVLRDGIRDGAVPRSRLVAACKDVAIPVDEAEELLSAALEDAGVDIEEFEPWGAQESDRETEDSEDANERADDALEFMVDQRRLRGVVFWTYLNGIPPERVDRDEEGALGRAMEEGQRAVFGALVRSPDLVDLLTRLIAPACTHVAAGGETKESESTVPDPIAQSGTKLLETVRLRCRSRDPATRASSQDLGVISAARSVVARLVVAVEQQPVALDFAEDLLRGYRIWDAAWTRMVLCNLRFVVHMARRGWAGGVPADDRIRRGTAA